MSAPGSTAGWLARELTDLPEGERLEVLGRRLREQVAALLEVADPTDLEPNRPLFELGLTSIRAVEMRNALSSHLDAALPATLLFDQPTIDALTSFLAYEILGMQSPEARHAPVDTTMRLMETIEQLSDEEAAAFLSGSGSS